MAAQGEKRKHSHSSLDLLEGVKAVVLDIEGTTTPITFVTDVLFTYARKNLKDHFEKNWEHEECQADVKALQEQAVKDKDLKGAVAVPEAGSDKEKLITALVDNVTWQMDNDRKTTALKQLQGHIWREGFTNKKIQAKLYDDVYVALKSWTAQDKKIYIYSSGSIDAQKLLFGHTEKGDYLQYLCGHFDTTTGPKQEKDSYSKIAKKLELKPQEVIFLSDVPAEVKAAADVGMNTSLVVRPGNKPLTDEDRQKYSVISSFAELDSSGNVEVPAKK